MANEFVARNGVIAQNNSVITGSLVVTNGITGSLFGTSSQALSASYSITSSVAYSGTGSFTGSFTGVITGSLFGTASYALSGISISSSFSTTASYVNPLRQTVTITGSLNVSGSTTQIGTNNLFGNTSLSGSLTISGSQGSIPTISIFGDVNQTGYTRFLPVTTNIDTSISASYIYVSASTNDLYFSQNSAGYANTTRLRWLEGNLYTGLLSGGVLSSTPGSTTFNLSSGSGIIVNLNASTGSADPYPTIQYVKWGQQLNNSITYSGSAKITYVGVNSSGTIVQQTVPWGSTDVTQWDTQIELGVILHLSGAVSTGVYNAPHTAYGFAQRTDDFIRAFGPVKLSGHALSPSGSSPTLSIIKTGGTAYNDGANYVNNPNHPSTVTDPAINISKIYRYYVSGSTPVIDTGVGGAGYTDIDNKNYVNTATGTLATVGNSNWSIQRVFWIPNSPTNAFLVYYGNARYGTLLNAVNAKDSEPFTEAPNTAQNAIFLGHIIIQGGGTGTPARDLNNSNEATIILGGLFRSINGIGSSGTTATSTTLAGLADVAISGPTQGDFLVYGGSQWNNTRSLTGPYSITGSLSFLNGGVTASLFGTASQATSASLASTSSVAYSGTGSFTGSFTGVITGSLFGTASQAVSSSYAYTASSAISSSYSYTASSAINASASLTAVSASYALTASYLLGYISPFPFTGSAQITGSLGVTGSITSTGNITTAGTLTAQTLVVQTITSSIEYSSGSNIFGSQLTDRQTMTGSVNITGSLNVVGAVSSTGSISAASAIGRGAYLNNNLIAAANSDVLVGLDINPNYVGGVGSTNTISNAGSGYATGSYTLVPLTGGSGTGATASIVASGSITSVTVTTAGSGYYLGDVLSASSASLGGSGSGFTYTVNTLSFTGVKPIGLRVEGINIGRGGGYVSTNTAIGNNALFSNTTGTGNTAIGISALYSNTTGNTNVAIGLSALSANTTTSQNTVVGASSLQNANSSGNSSFGFYNLNGLTSGNNNVTFGGFSGRFIADGATVLTSLSNSILIGYQTYPLANSQTNQIVIGYGAIGNGSNTTVIGNSSTTATRLYGNLLLGTNTDAGTGVLQVTGLTTFTGTTASDTAPLGSELAAVTGTGTNWTLAGTNLNVGGYTHTTGSVVPLTTALAAVNGTYYQIAYTITGRTAGSITIAYGGTSTSGITATGASGPLASSTAVLTITPTTDFDGTVVLSIKSISTSSASSTFANSSGTSAIEMRASSNTSNTFIGLLSGRRNTTGTANTFIGSTAGQVNTTGGNNAFLGYNAGNANTTGNSNSFFGTYAGQVNTTGGNNTFIGQQAGQANTTGNSNTFIGLGAGAGNTTGGINTYIGIYAGIVSNGGGNVYLGGLAAFNSTSGDNNVVIGNSAARFIANGSTSATIISNSILIGNGVKPLADNQTNQIVIGYATTGLGSNTTVIGNSSTTSTALWGNLVLGGNLITGSATGSGYTLNIAAPSTNGALLVSGSTVISGSLNVTAGITGSLFGTSSWAQNALTASYMLGGSASSILYQTSSAATTWSFSHYLQTQYPVFTVYDINNNVIIPQRIFAQDTSSALIYFSTPTLGTAVASKGGYSASVVTSATTAQTAVSSSYALTASYALNSGGPNSGQTTVYTQIAATSSWTFTHNLNTRSPLIQIYDTTYNQIVPQYISSSDSNTVIIKFGVPVAGTVVGSTGGTLTVTGSNVILNQVSAAATWSFNHNLNYQYPVFQIYDSNNEVIVPQRIVATDLTSSLIYFPSAVSGKAVATVGGMSGSGGSGVGFPYSGSAVITGSFLVSQSFVDFSKASYVTGSFTGSLFGTSSWSVSSSIAFSGTGSFTGSFSGIHTGSLFGTASQATSASFALTASYVNALSQSVVLSGSFTQAGYYILTTVSQSLNYVDDVAAAAGGVPLGGIYRNGNFVLIRIS